MTGHLFYRCTRHPRSRSISSSWRPGVSPRQSLRSRSECVLTSGRLVLIQQSIPFVPFLRLRILTIYDNYGLYPVLLCSSTTSRLFRRSRGPRRNLPSSLSPFSLLSFCILEVILNLCLSFSTFCIHQHSFSQMSSFFSVAKCLSTD